MLPDRLQIVHGLANPNSDNVVARKSVAINFTGKKNPKAIRIFELNIEQICVTQLYKNVPHNFPRNEIPARFQEKILTNQPPRNSRPDAIFSFPRKSPKIPANPCAWQKQNSSPSAMKKNIRFN